MDEILVRIVAPHFVAGVVFDSERKVVVFSAPIVRWMMNCHYRYVEHYCSKKGWLFDEVESSTTKKLM